jgi:CBS domain-containing protein
MPLAELEHALIEHRVSGFPVVEDGDLVGVVSRSDIVRIIDVERSHDGQISDYYRLLSAPNADLALQVERATGARVGARIEGLTVADAMVKEVITADAASTLEHVAMLMVDRGIHRLPITEAGKLVGIVTSLDLVRQIAEGHYRAA